MEEIDPRCPERAYECPFEALEAQRELGVALNDAIPFDPFYYPISDGAKKLNGNVAFHIRGRQRERALKEGAKLRAKSKDVQARYDATLEAFLSHLIVTSIIKPDCWLYCSLKRTEWNTPNRYGHQNISYRQVKATIDALEDMDIVEIQKGYFDKGKGQGKRTRIRLKDTLLPAMRQLGLTKGPVDGHYGRKEEEEVIVLKGAKVRSKAPLMDYEDTKFTTKERARLKRLNRYLSFTDITLNLPQYITTPRLPIQEGEGISITTPLSLTPKALHPIKSPPDSPYCITGFTKDGEPYEIYVNPTKKTLARVFNNGTFDEGGRLYRAWWQGAPKDLRKYILINGEETVEIDYCQLHPTLLYAEHGLPLPPGDLYDIPGYDRKLVKRMLNAMLNHRARFTRPPDGLELPEGKTIEELQDAILEKHKPIQDAFFSGVGLRLQRKDSDIMMDVLGELMDGNVPALPIHDSVIVRLRDLEATQRIMKDVFFMHTGVECPLDTSGTSDMPMAA